VVGIRIRSRIGIGIGWVVVIVAKVESRQRGSGNEKEIDFVSEDLSGEHVGHSRWAWALARAWYTPIHRYSPGAGAAAAPAEAARLLRLRSLQRGHIGLLQHVGRGADSHAAAHGGRYSAQAVAAPSADAPNAAASPVPIAIPVAIAIPIVATIVGGTLL